MTDVRVLSTAELQQGLDRDSGLHVLNVQTDQFFTGELIPGSRRIPLDGIEHGVQTLPKDASIRVRDRTPSSCARASPG